MRLPAKRSAKRPAQKVGVPVCGSAVEQNFEPPGHDVAHRAKPERAVIADTERMSRRQRAKGIRQRRVTKRDTQ